MKLDTFFDNFGLLADAPNGVRILRQMILQLAVQGKLVPQDSKDEPASVLLEKIKAVKERLIKEKKIKKTKPLPPISLDEMPYKLPKGWEWQQLKSVFYPISVGKNKIKTSDVEQTGKFPVVDQGKQYVSGFYNGKDKIIKIPGPVIIFGDHTRELKLVDFDFVAGADGVKILRPLIINENYFFIVLKSLAIVSRGYGRHYKLLLNNLFPVPPLSEQKRIVVKVDELMALCDELEARKQQVSKNCIQLNDASIHKLLTARESKKFSKHWQRICDNFDLLYSKPENVNKLRQTILQLAVQGKLVPQDPKDEPASVLLEKIKAEKERLVKENKIKKSKQFPPIDPSDVPYNLPNGWEWVKLEQIRKTIEYGTSSKASPNDIGIPILRMNNIQNGKLFYDNLKYVKKDIKDLPRLLLKKNDILFNRTNSYELVGKTALYTYDDDLFTFASYLIRVSIFTDWIDPEYTANAINSYYFRHTQIEPEVTQQCGQANFNGTKLANTLLPLPSSKEQKRIVAKVDELMALCDELETSLSQSQTGCDMLMEAAVAEILAA